MRAANQAVYFFAGSKLIELQLDSLEERIVSEVDTPYPPGGRANPTADGKYICSIVTEPETNIGKKTISYSYSSFVHNSERKPHSLIFKVSIDSGAWEVIHEDRRSMGHINTSPKLPDIMTFCHKGPWYRIEQRIWGLNIRTGEVWKIREQDGNISVGHEYWFSDGEQIGYHGFHGKDLENHMFGNIRWDNRDHTEASFPFRSTHFHSLDASMIVGDGTNAFAANARPYFQLFRWDGK